MIGVENVSFLTDVSEIFCMIFLRTSRRKMR